VADRIAIDYRNTTVYYETALNAVGATDSLTLRTGLLVPGALDAYVKRFGTPYPVINVLAGTAKTVPDGAAGNIGRFRIYAMDGTLLGTVTDNGASVYADGAAVAANTDVYIVLDCTLGAYTIANTNFDLVTDIDGGAGLRVILSPETVTAAGGETITWYVSSSGSTYYDAEYMYGGGRHAPQIGSAKYPYFSIIAGVAVANACVEVMDSETYGGTVTYGALTIQAALGQTPRIVRVIGPYDERDALTEWNNSTAVYVNPNGNDANPGTWALPYATIAAAWAGAAGAVSVVVGGYGAIAGMIFTENITLNAAQTLEVDHHLRAELRPVGFAVNVTMTAAANLYGFDVLGSSLAVNMNGAAGTVRQCRCQGAGVRCNNGTATVRETEIASAVVGVNAIAGIGSLKVIDCAIHDCVQGISATAALGAATNIAGNEIYECSTDGMAFSSTVAVGAMVLNTIYNCANGMNFSFAGAVNIVPTDCIITDCTNGIWMGNAATTLTINFCNTGNNDTQFGGPGVAFLTNNNQVPLAGDPDPLLVDPANGLLGIRPDSPCYHAGSVAENVGAQRYCVYFNGNTAVIDGIIIDGIGKNHDGISPSTAARTNCVVKWCTIKRHQSMGIDNYGAAATTWTIANCLFDECGTGAMLAHQDNTVEECAFEDCDWAGIYVTNTGQALMHLSIYGGAYGLNLSAAASAALIDSIFSGQSSYAIYSDAWIFPTFCCIDGAVSALVNISDPSNLTTTPLFLDTASDDKDLHLWSLENGYPAQSPCLNAASDGYDMGCYLIDRGVTDESLETYVFPTVVTNLEEEIVGKSESGFETVAGSSSRSAKTHKRRFELSWGTGTAAPDDEFREMMELFSTMIEDDHQGWTAEQCIFALHKRPTELILGEFTGTVDADALTVYDPTAAWIRNAYRGYDVTIEWYESAIGVLNAVAKTLAVAGAAWVVDEWAGYWFPQAIEDACGTLAYRWFRILSNTVNTITYSDPYDLSTGVAANFRFQIVSWHKIASNDAQYMCLEEGELLRDGDYTCYVDRIRTRLAKSGIGVRRQLPYRSDYTHDRIPDNLRLEEI